METMGKKDRSPTQGKLNISIDKNKKFNWKYTKIAGPCSVEGPSIIDIARRNIL